MGTYCRVNDAKTLPKEYLSIVVTDGMAQQHCLFVAMAG